MGISLYLKYSLGLLCLFSSETDGACTFPSYMTTGTWYDNKFIEVEIWGNSETSGMYMKEYSISRKGSTTNLTCYLSSGNKYILRTTTTISATISGIAGEFYYYLCMDVTQISSYSFYHFIQSESDTNGERTVAKPSSESPSVSDICTTPIATQLFQVMVRKDYENIAVQQCSDPFLGDFSFQFDNTINTDVTSTGNLTICDTSTTGNVSYKSGLSNTIKLAFSANGYFGCVASITSSNTYYTSWFNFDSATDQTVHSRFGCVVATYDDTNVTATIRVRMCQENQTSNSIPTDTSPLYPETGVTSGGLIKLFPYRTCVPQDDVSSSSSNVGVIVAVVIILLLIVGGIVGGILFYKFYYLPKKAEKDRLLEEQRKPRSHIGMMKKALEAGVGGGLHKGDQRNGILNMVCMEDDDEGIEGSVTGMNPNKFQEHNNNMKLNAKFIGTSTPISTSGVETNFSDPHSIPESMPIREKTKVTSGFSADVQGHSSDTSNTTTNQNGQIPNTPRTMSNQNGQIPNGRVPSEKLTTSATVDQPTVSTTAIIQNDNVGKIQREKSISGGTIKTENINNKVKTTVASVNPFTEEKPKIIQNVPKVEEKRDEKLRKSVTFAGDNETKPPSPDPITLPREPSNLLGPRDTTLPEIDLKNF